MFQFGGFKNAEVLFSMGWGLVVFFLLIKFKDKPQLELGAATLPSAVTKTDVYVFVFEV